MPLESQFFPFTLKNKVLLQKPNLMVIQNKRLLTILFSVPLLLLIPLIAMQFTQEVSWNLADFLVAGTLLLGTGLLLELVLRKVPRQGYRVLFVLAIVILLLLVWAELAVGLFDGV